MTEPELMFPQYAYQAITRIGELLERPVKPSKEDLIEVLAHLTGGRHDAFEFLDEALAPDGISGFRSNFTGSIVLGTPERLLSLPRTPSLNALRDAVFIRSIFSGLNLADIAIERVVFAGTSKDRSSFALHGIGLDLSGSYLRDVVFAYTDLRGLRAVDTQFDVVVFNEVDLSGACFNNYASPPSKTRAGAKRPRRSLTIFGDDGNDLLPIEKAVFHCQEKPPDDFRFHIRNTCFDRCLFSGFFQPSTIDAVRFVFCEFRNLEFDGSLLDPGRSIAHSLITEKCTANGIINVMNAKNSEIELNSIGFDGNVREIRIADCNLQRMQVSIRIDSCLEPINLLIENSKIRDFIIKFESEENGGRPPVHITTHGRVVLINPRLEGLDLHLHQDRSEPDDGFFIYSDSEGGGTLERTTLICYDELRSFLEHSEDYVPLSLNSCRIRPPENAPGSAMIEIEKTDFRDVTLSGTEFITTKFRRCKFGPLADVQFWDCTFVSCSFEEPGEGLESRPEMARAVFLGQCRFETSDDVREKSFYFKNCHFGEDCSFTGLDQSEMLEWVLTDSAIYPFKSLRRLKLKDCRLDGLVFLPHNGSGSVVCFRACELENDGSISLPQYIRFEGCNVNKLVIYVRHQDTHLTIRCGDWVDTVIMPYESLAETSPSLHLSTSDDLKLSNCSFQNFTIRSDEPEGGESSKPILRRTDVTSDSGGLPLFYRCRFIDYEKLAQSCVLSNVSLDSISSDIKSIIALEGCQLRGSMSVAAKDTDRVSVQFEKILVQDRNLSLDLKKVELKKPAPALYKDFELVYTKDGKERTIKPDGSVDQWSFWNYPTPGEGKYSQFTAVFDKISAEFMVNFRHSYAEGVKHGNRARMEDLLKALKNESSLEVSSSENRAGFERGLQTLVENGLFEDSSREEVKKRLDVVHSIIEELLAESGQSCVRSIDEESIERIRKITPSECERGSGAMAKVEECFLHRINRKPIFLLGTESIDEWLSNRFNLTARERSISRRDTRKVFFDFPWLEAVLHESIEESKSGSGQFDLKIELNDEHDPPLFVILFGNTPNEEIYEPRLAKDFLSKALKKAFAAAYSWRGRWVGDLPDSLKSEPVPLRGVWFKLYVEIARTDSPIGGITCNEYVLSHTNRLSSENP